MKKYVNIMCESGVRSNNALSVRVVNVDHRSIRLLLIKYTNTIISPIATSIIRCCKFTKRPITYTWT